MTSPVRRPRAAWSAASRLSFALTLVILAGCEAGLKSGPPPGQEFQPLQLSVTPSSVDFTAPVGGPNPGPLTVQIQNAGPGTVTGLGVATTLYEPVVGGWLTASIGGADFAPATLTLSVDVAGMLPGLYFAIVPVVSTVTGVLERDVVVTLQITPAPIIQISPDTVALAGTVGGAAPGAQPAAITNIGTGNITGMSVGSIIYDAAGSGWLSGSLDQPIDPAILTLQATPTGLAAGTYTAKVVVQSSVAGIVPDTVNVVLDMTAAAAPPQLSVAPTNIVMAANGGGPNPAPATAAITNSGGGTITNLTLGAIVYTPAGNWLTAGLNQTTAPATLNLSANVIGLAPGHYRGRVPVTAAGVTGSPRNVAVELNVNAVASLSVAPLTVNFAGTIGQPAPSPQQVSITNGGPGVLTGIAAGPIAYGPGATGWLQASLGATTTPTAVVLTASSVGLVTGSYTATIPVSSTTPGMGTQTIVVNFAVASQTGFFNIIAGDGQTGLVDSILPQTLVVRATGANFQPIPGVAVLWTVNNGGVLSSVTTLTSALGEAKATWKLGHFAGLQTVRVSSSGRPTLTFTADAQLPRSGGNQYPNEPAGYVRFAEHNMSSLPLYPKTLGGLAGSWFGFPQNDPDLVIVNPDTTAPESPPLTIRTRFPAGFGGGSAPVNMGGWDAAGNGASGQKSKVYTSIWVKILGTDYENHPVITKMGFIGYGYPPTAAQNQGVWELKGNGSQSPQSSFPLQFVQQGPVNRTMQQNVATGRVMTVGTWHHWENVFVLNTLGQQNGIFKWWIDGVLIMDYSDVEYIVNGSTTHFHGWKWNPTWGGTCCTRTRQDFIAIDHVYLSGIQ